MSPYNLFLEEIYEISNKCYYELLHHTIKHKIAFWLENEMYDCIDNVFYNLDVYKLNKLGLITLFDMTSIAAAQGKFAMRKQLIERAKEIHPKGTFVDIFVG